jgi:hypothetical protein
MIDDEAVRAAAEAQRLVRARERWLLSIRWQFFATCKWRYPVSADAVVARVTQWILVPHPECYAVAGVQRGPIAGRYHAHVLIGNANPFVGAHLRGQWRHGDVEIDLYRHGHGGVRYLVMQADDVVPIGDAPFESFVPRRRRRQRHR